MPVVMISINLSCVKITLIFVSCELSRFRFKELITKKDISYVRIRMLNVNLVLSGVISLWCFVL
ncbi:hypothetical protein VAE122_2430003 [Vibrio aestuarianus]|nr:hypothetical protein VAE122_2430003 [Vibrio aestuarianus]